MNFDALNDYVILDIVKYFTSIESVAFERVSSRLKNLIRTSKTFVDDVNLRDLIVDNQPRYPNLRKLDLNDISDDHYEPDKFVSDLIKAAPHLEYLNSRGMEGVFLNYVLDHPSEKIAIKEYVISYKSREPIKDHVTAIKKCVNLDEVLIDLRNYSEADQTELIDVLIAMPIKKLSLSETKHSAIIRIKDFSKFEDLSLAKSKDSLNSLTGFRNSKTFRLKKLNLSGFSAAAIKEVLSIKGLNTIGINHVGDEVFELGNVINKLINNNQDTIKSFDLYAGPNVEFNFDQLFPALGKCPKLQRLFYDGSYHIKELDKLYFERNNCGLTKTSKLRSIVIWNTLVTVDGIKNVLENCSEFEYLECNLVGFNDRTVVNELVECVRTFANLNPHQGLVVSCNSEQNRMLGGFEEIEENNFAIYLYS